MNNEKIRKKLDEYIDDWAENPQYAVMINGEWGCGKTYFAKDYINKRNEKDRLAWYISAFGVKSVEELDERIFEAAHPIITDKKQKKWLALGYNVLRGATKHKLGIDVKDYAEPIFGVLSNKEDTYSSCQVIFVDDIERASISLNELFGYFSQIIDRETRVVFIANIDEIEKKEDYNNLQEKIILETYTVEPEYESAINRFWDLELNNKFQNLKINAQTMAERLDNRNLRNIHRIIYSWKQLSSKLPDDIKLETEYLNDIFKEFFVLYSDYLNGDYNNFYNNGILKSDKILQKMKQTMKNFYQTEYTPELKGANIWPKVIVAGEFDNEEWLKIQFENEHQIYVKKEKERKEHINELNSTLNKLKACIYNNSSETDIKLSFEKMLNEFDKGLYTRFDEIMTFVRIYLNFMYGEILPKEYDTKKLVNILEKLLREHRNDIFAMPGIERMSKESLIDVNDDGLQKCIYDLFDAAQLSMGINSEDIFTKKNAFLSFISERQRAVTERIDVRFLEKLNIDAAFKWMGDDVNQHRNLLRFLEYRYRKDFANDELHESDYSELVYVNEIINKYDQITNSLAHSFRLDYRDYKEIRDKYNDLSQYMQKIIASNQGV